MNKSNNNGEDLAITIQNNIEDGYFHAKYIGTIEDQEFLSTWKNYLENSEGELDLNALHDLEDANISKVSLDSLFEIAQLAGEIYEKFNKRSITNVVYTTNLNDFAISNMYDSFTCSATQIVRIFEDKEESVTWIKKQKV